MPNNAEWQIGQEFVGLGHVHIFTGGAIRQARGKIEIGTGTLKGCTENNGGRDSVPIVICLEKLDYGFLAKLFKGMSPEKLMTEVTKFVSKKEDELKDFYGASKIDINYSWNP